ncbi:MAG: 2-oxoacid:acceptor oxidoreductase subunit alpha [Vulcanimicrobiota bacterium]
MSTGTATEEFKQLDSVVVRFSGDSGDGMQLTGTQFTNASAIAGNDISTFPDFPAEIRAPAGTLAGVSGFQVNLSSYEIFTPGDDTDVLVAMNPAALAANLPDLRNDCILIINEDAFSKHNIKKAGFAENPLDDGTLERFRLHRVPLTNLNREAMSEIEGLSQKEIDRTKNFFALGLICWMYDRPMEPTMEWVNKKFKKSPILIEANIKAFKSGYHYGETTETFQMRFKIAPAKLDDGIYRQITGNEALALGLVTAGKLAGKEIFYGSYPITPASDILHNLAALRHFGVRTFQAEDEIAAMGATVGAAFGGAFAVTASSGPGVALKSEALNLGLALELPMVLIDVQRGGPSTGLPTKTEQSDLLMALFGRNGEAPLPILAACSPADCFDTAIEAFRFAVRATCPVILLSDGYLGNSAEPWKIPDPSQMEPIKVVHPEKVEGEDFMPYARDPETLGRPWAIPGTPGLEHRVGGLGKAPLTGNVSYRPEHHAQMVADRQAKVDKLVDIIPDQTTQGPDSGDLLVMGWGSTYGAIRAAVARARTEGYSVSSTQLRHICPLPGNLLQLMGRFKRVLIPEMNSGQLAFYLRGKLGVPIESLTQVTGRPFKIETIQEAIRGLLGKDAK